jgi:hypothetical protein
MKEMFITDDSEGIEFTTVVAADESEATELARERVNDEIRTYSETQTVYRESGVGGDTLFIVRLSE